MAPETPCVRLTASDLIDEATKEKLQAAQVTLDPLRLLDEIRAMQQHIAGLSRGEHVRVPPHRDADLDLFLRGLQTSWQDGEARPTHKPDAKPKRHWRTRQDPFADVWPKVVIWLEREPDRTAKELLQRLMAEEPGRFRTGQLRTLQRRVKRWRTEAARKLLLAADQPDEAVSRERATQAEDKP